MIEVRIKVCGLTDPANALACANAGANWIGLNFHSPSPRSIPVERGAEIASAISGKAEPVGLFVDRPIAELFRIVDAIGLGIIQLHGDETADYLRECARINPALRVIRAFRLNDAESVERMTDSLRVAQSLGCPPHAILVDAHVPGLPGGTGRSLSFDILDRLPAHPRLILAGGLNPSNVAERVARVRPWMVDVASGVESSPGFKDIGLVSAFVNEARGFRTTSLDTYVRK